MAAFSWRPRASAAVRLAGRRTRFDQRQLLDRVASRLEALGALQRLMLAPARDTKMDLAERLVALCQAMVIARYADQGIELRLSVETMVIGGGQAWRILLVVAELLVNAAHHAFDCEGGTVLVDLFDRGDAVVCAVRDNGHRGADAPTSRRGYGSSVVEMLVQELGGQLRSASSAAGTSVELTVPRATDVPLPS